MINMFLFKKWAALILNGFLPMVSFGICLFFFGFWWGLAIGTVILLGTCFLSAAFLANPFTKMVEGKGILVLPVSSTGVIRPFIVKAQAPYIVAKNFKDIFNRSAIHNLAAPQEAATPYETDKQGGLIIKLTDEELNRGRFALYHYPVLLWNEQIKSVLTKDFLSGLEKESFAEHGVLYLNRLMEDLTSSVRDFGRYIVELTKPKEGGFLKNWGWLIIIIALAILAAMFLPAIMNAVKGFSGTATSALPQGSINPMP
jgi:hypothetical protein